MLSQKIFKIRIFNVAYNEFQTTKFPSVTNSLTLGKFPDFQRSLSNFLTFPAFPGQWQPRVKEILPVALGNINGPWATFYILLSWPF